MRPSRASLATRSLFDRDHGLPGRRGVNIWSHRSSSSEFVFESIQPNASASSTASSYETPVFPAALR
jgi:hypothetical protein